MKAPISYYGGKTRLAPWIVSLMPPHRVYVEPFFGSGAVLFAKPSSIHEVVNDLDGNLVCFFRMLRSRPLELERACRLSPYARAEFLAADLAGDSIDDLERARRFFVRTTQGFNRSTGAVGWSLSVQRNSNDARTAANLVERFERCAQRLQHVAVESRPAVQCIRRYGVEGALIYVDPPYRADTRRGLAKRTGDYAVEYNTEEEHRELAEALCATPATVLLSGYPSKLYDELYSGWDRWDRAVPSSAANHAGAARRATEVIWSNRPLSQQLGLLLGDRRSACVEAVGEDGLRV
jgi:DNA adenine methylase